MKQQKKKKKCDWSQQKMQTEKGRQGVGGRTFMVCGVAVRKGLSGGWWLWGRHYMTCGTHTTPDVTGGAFGFNLFCQGPF